MGTAPDRFKEALRAAKLSLTMPRLSVFNTLLTQGPLTIHELTVAIPIVNRSSIYRTVEALEKVGVIHRLQIGWKYKLELSDRFSHHHHHAICNTCGQITDLPEDSVIESHLRRLAREHDFSAQGHQLEIRGLCANCRAFN